MTKTCTFFLFLYLFIGTAYAQTDRHGNPVFNSVSLEESTQHGFKVSANYYTLQNNIDNKQSSVFISTAPSLDQIQKAATSLPANFYILSKDTKMQYLLLLLPSQEDKKQSTFMLLNPTTGEKKVIGAKLSGELTQIRANELIANRYDEKAQIDETGKYIYFNGTKIPIIKQSDIDKALSKIIKGLKGEKATDSGVVFLDKQAIKKYVQEESINGGELDYWSKLNVAKEKTVGIKVDGFFMQKQHAAVYLWGKAVAELGVETLEQAKELLMSVRGEQNKMEQMHLESGYTKMVTEK